MIQNTVVVLEVAATRGAAAPQENQQSLSIRIATWDPCAGIRHLTFACFGTATNRLCRTSCSVPTRVLFASCYRPSIMKRVRISNTFLRQKQLWPLCATTAFALRPQWPPVVRICGGWNCKSRSFLQKYSLVRRSQTFIPQRQLQPLRINWHLRNRGTSSLQ